LAFFSNELGALVSYNAACPEVMQHYTERIENGKETRGELNKSKILPTPTCSKFRYSTTLEPKTRDVFHCAFRESRRSQKKKTRAIAGCVLEKGKWRHGKVKRKAKTAVNSSYIQPTMSHKSSNAENNA
jgi:hypothetical protein